MKWVVNAFRNGILLGISLLFVLSIPLFIFYQNGRNLERKLQVNLVPSCGKTDTVIRTAVLNLTGMVNGVQRNDVSGSLDQGTWFMPKHGVIRLEGKPGLNTVYLAYENRMISAQVELSEDQETSLTLDVGMAPEVADLVTIASESPESLTFTLPAQYAEKLSLQNEVSGTTFQKDGDQFVIQIPAKYFTKNAIVFSAQLANYYGTANTFIAITKSASKTPIEIRTIEEFSAMRTNLSAHYSLMNDLDFSDQDEWQPIGSSDFPFQGIFDGNGFTIKGLHLIDQAYTRGHFSLFGECKNVILRNLIVDKPLIDVQNQGNPNECFTTVAGALHQSLAEKIAVVGGRINAGNGVASGIFCGIDNSIVRDIFNSANVFSSFQERVMRNTGGVIGSGVGYITRCANEGTVSGRHLTGGIIGYGANITLSHCINSGEIYGQPLVGEFPPGAIFQTADDGLIRSSLFVRGTAERGGTLFGKGILNGLQLIEPDQLRNPAALTVLGSFEEDSAQWEFIDDFAKGPVPVGIFTKGGKGNG